MRKLLLSLLRYALPGSIAMLLIAGTMALATIALGLMRYEETVFTWALWTIVLAYSTICLSIFGALFLKCSYCGARALVYQNPDGEAGTTIAIFETRACHHCGSKL